MLNVHLNFLLALSLLLWWKTCPEKEPTTSTIEVVVYTVSTPQKHHTFDSILVSALYWLLLKWELYHLWDAWCSKLATVMCPEWGDGESPRWRTSLRAAQVPLLVDVGIPSISAPPTDWSPNETKTLSQLTSLWRTSANGLRRYVGSPTADGHTLTLSHGTQHTQHLEELSFCVSQQACRPHQQKYERTQGWPMESSHPKSSELGLSSATVHSMPQFQVCNCPQPPFNTFSCSSLTLGSFLLSRPPWNMKWTMFPTLERASCFAFHSTWQIILQSASLFNILDIHL